MCISYVLAAHTMVRFFVICFFTALTPRLWAEPLEVLHWWTSAGETKAVQVLQDDLAKQGIQWQDSAIAGGAGEGAMAVLKTKVINGKAPMAAQMIGPNIRSWAQLGFLNELDDIATREHWSMLLFPTIDRLVRYQQHYVAAPFGIHRVNWLWLNPHILKQLNTSVPQTWDEFFTYAELVKQAGYIPLVHGNQPWQTVTLFENLVLSEGGPELYRQIFVDLDLNALNSKAVTRSFERLRKLKTYMDNNMSGRSWNQGSKMVLEGEAAMQIMGDWVKGEFDAWGKRYGKDYLCAPVPGTQNYHLYSVDTFIMFARNDEKQDRQLAALTKTITSDKFQIDYNLAKGSIPVRRDLSVADFDPCARNSHNTFKQAEKTNQLAPSLAHSMASNAEVEDIIFDIVNRFFHDDRLTAKHSQARLIRALAAVKE